MAVACRSTHAWHFQAHSLYGDLDVKNKTRHEHHFLSLPVPRSVMGKPSARRRSSPDGGLAERNKNKTRPRRSPLRLAVIVKSSRHILIFGGSQRIQTMMQIYASAARLRSSRCPILITARKPLECASNPLPRIVFGKSSLTSAGSPKLAFSVSPIAGSLFAVAYAADLNWKPSGTKPVLT